MIRIALVLTLIAAPAGAQTTAFPDAAASDPVTLGWMQGSPVPPDKLIRFEDGSSRQFPQTRWSYSHQRELMPTVNVARGNGPVSRLTRAERADIDAVTFMPIGGTKPMSWKQSLAANYTDGIVVLHRGRIVYERYFGTLKPGGQHLAFSVTKSFIGVVAASLVLEGRLDADAAVSRYLPELAASGFGDATVRQLLDMTTGLNYTEVYADPASDVHKLRMASGRFARTPGYTGPLTTADYLVTVPKQGAHGQRFAYKTPNSEVLGWLIRRVTGTPLADVLAERIWARRGMEQDGYFSIDTAGAPSAGGGFSLGLRDMARFGEMMRLGGRYNGRQIVPAAVREGRLQGGLRAGTLPDAARLELPQPMVGQSQ